MQRSILLFENSLKTEATREKYLYYLGRFKDFYKLKDYDSMLTIEQKQLQIMVEDYVMMLKKRVSPNTVNTYMAGGGMFLFGLKFKIPYIIGFGLGLMLDDIGDIGSWLDFEKGGDPSSFISFE